MTLWENMKRSKSIENREKSTSRITRQVVDKHSKSAKKREKSKSRRTPTRCKSAETPEKYRKVRKAQENRKVENCPTFWRFDVLRVDSLLGLCKPAPACVLGTTPMQAQKGTNHRSAPGCSGSTRDRELLFLAAGELPVLFACSIPCNSPNVYCSLWHSLRCTSHADG